MADQSQEILDLNYDPEVFVQMMAWVFQRYGALPFAHAQVNNTYYIFATDTLKKAWESAGQPEESNFFFMKFDGAAPKILLIEGLPNTMDVMKGRTGNILAFTVNEVDSSTGQKRSVPTQVTFTFRNNGQLIGTTQRNYDTSDITLNIDGFLRDGKNEVEIFVQSRMSAMNTSGIININMVELQVTSQFDVAVAIGQDAPIRVDYYARGAKNKNVYFYVDGALVKETVVSGSQSDTMMSVELPNTYDNTRKHRLHIQATMEVNGETQKSNVLYYEFSIEGAAQKNVVIALDLPSDTTIANIAPTILARQYAKQTVVWALFTTSADNKEKVSWQLHPISGEDIAISTITADQQTESQKRPDPLQFVPTATGEYLLQAIIDGVPVASYTMTIAETDLEGFFEYETGRTCRLIALGRNDSEPDDVRSRWDYRNVTTTFSNDKFSWTGSALRLTQTVATINIAPFAQSGNNAPHLAGATVIIDFSTFTVLDPDVCLASVGDIIRIYGNRLTFRSADGRQLEYLFPQNKRLQVAFVVNPNATHSAYPRTFDLCVDGIIERTYAYESSDRFSDATAKIVLGSESGRAGINVYSVRCYTNAVTLKNTLNLTILDSDHMGEMVDDNAIYVPNTNVIDHDAVVTRIPTLSVTGSDFKTQLIDKHDKSFAYVDAEWTDPQHPELNWTINNLVLRRHGQSTLDYPVPSIKGWFDKKDDKGVSISVMRDARGNIINRWGMKPGAMPLKKFIWQANYVDSSCAKNGALMQLISDVYYNTQVDGRYVLRTPAQVVAADRNSTDRTGWNPSAPDVNGNALGEFPYRLRTTPDAMPCCMFYRDDEQSEWNFVGMYVLMNDKKTEQLYGQSSIYPFSGDPFAFYRKKDGTPPIWDNEGVTRFEILRNTDDLTRFISVDIWYDDADPNLKDEDDVTNEGSEEGEEFTATYRWEQSFELIFPDPDDLTSAKYAKHEQRLHGFCAWLASCYQVDNGGSGSVQRFREEAPRHLYLDAWAAYYNVMMDFGLFDNSVRNLQLITFDGGQTWWPYLWDCDVQAGSINSGTLEYGPRVDRQTYSQTRRDYAFAGHDNWLWNALEAMPEFKTLCSRIRTGMSAAGYTYRKIMDVQNDDYCNRWNESMYNESMLYKYKEQYKQNGNASFLNFLLGRGIPFREYWMKTNMDYWDARLAAGEYTAHSLAIRLDTAPKGLPIRLRFGADTFFAWGYTQGGSTTTTFKQVGIEVKADQTFTVIPDMDMALNDPLHFYSAQNISEFDISEYAYKLNTFLMDAFADDVTGSQLKVLRFGIPDEQLLSGVRNAFTNITLSGMSRLVNLTTIQVQGFTGIDSMDFSVLSALTHIYAKGSAFKAVNLASGSRYAVAELPASLTAVEWQNVSFSSLTFFDPHDVSRTYTFPVSANTIRLYNVGAGNDVLLQMVSAWLAYLDDHGLLTPDNTYELALTNIVWDCTYDDLARIARIGSHGSITGRANLDVKLDAGQMQTLMAAFGDNCFVDGASFRINAKSDSTLTILADGDGVSVEGDTITVIQGYTATLRAVSFPISSHPVQWYQYISGQYVAIQSTTNIGSYNGQAVHSIDPSGVITTTECPTGDVTVRLAATQQGNSGGELNGTVTLRIVRRTYPTRVSLQPGGDFKLSNGQYQISMGRSGTLTAVYSPSVFNGTPAAPPVMTVSGSASDRIVINRPAAGSNVWRIDVLTVDAVLDARIAYSISWRGGSSVSGSFAFAVIDVIAALLTNSLIGGNVALYRAFIGMSGVPAPENDGRYSSDEIRAISVGIYLAGNTEVRSLSCGQYYIPYYLPNAKSLVLRGCTALGTYDDLNETLVAPAVIDASRMTSAALIDLADSYLSITL